MRSTERPSQRLSVALACAEGDWPYDDWPAPDDPHVGRVVRLSPPFRVAGGVDVLVVHCADPVAVLRGLDAGGVPVIFISPRRDTEAVVEAFRSGAGYLAESDYCPQMLSSALVAATVGHTYLSPSACAALRDGVRRIPTSVAVGAGAGVGDAVERLRSLLSPRERQVMELLSTGLGAQEIGLRLRLSEKTVRNNLSNIYAKLDARGSTDAVLRWLGATPATPVLRT